MYHLNIVGNGRVTLALLKMIFDDELATYIREITVWCRKQTAFISNKLITRVDHVTLGYIGPHNHAGFTPPETIWVDGKTLIRLFDRKTALSVVGFLNHPGTRHMKGDAHRLASASQEILFVLS